ncbi:hypothetical protein VTO73DRAFT_2803 [Trametes versicolor]
MGKKTRPARRLFGRPPEGPGPQQTFNSTFQVTPAPSPTHQAQFRLSTPAHSESPAPAPPSSIAPGDRAHDDQREGAKRAGGSKRSSLNAPSASPTAPEDHLWTGDAVAGGPSKRRRPSIAAHRPTLSTPAAAVSTTQAAGGRFLRSRSSTAVAADIINAIDNNAAGPSSLPARLRDGSLPATSDYRGTPQLAPSTPGQYSPYGTTSPFHTPSSGSGASTSHRRLPSYDLPFASPADNLPWTHASPSPAPCTPGSHRGASVPLSTASESSPSLGLVIGDFSPEMPSLDADGEELPPLTPDHAAALELPHHWGRPRSHSSTQVTRGRREGFFLSAEATQSSISVPEELQGLQFPPEVFGLDEPAYEDPHTPEHDELAQLPGLHALSPSRYPPSSRSQAPRRASGF